MTTRLEMPARLPESKRDTQHPLSDKWFVHAKALLEACSIDSGGCEECDLQSQCLKLFDTLSYTCADKPLDAHRLLDFAVKYVELIIGEKIVSSKTKNINDIFGNSYIVTTDKRICKCQRCGYVWATKQDSPQRCANKNCNSPYWNKPKKENN